MADLFTAAGIDVRPVGEGDKVEVFCSYALCRDRYRIGNPDGILPSLLMNAAVMMIAEWIINEKLTIGFDATGYRFLVDQNNRRVTIIQDLDLGVGSTIQNGTSREYGAPENRALIQAYLDAGGQIPVHLRGTNGNEINVDISTARRSCF